MSGRVLSKIEFFKNVPIPTDFKHAPLFRDNKAQINWFDKFKVNELTFEGSYQRVEEQIKTPFKYEQLVDLNYVRVTNPSHESSKDNNIWYGFIMDVHYINDGLVIVDWVVDPIQTFMFKWQLGNAFIERGMLDVVRGNFDDYYLDDRNVSLLSSAEPVGVDGLAYEMITKDTLDIPDYVLKDGDDKHVGQVTFMIVVIAAAKMSGFVGAPGQLEYYILPFNKVNGYLIDFRIGNIRKGDGTKISISSTLNGTRNDKYDVMDAVKALSEDLELTKAGGAVVSSFTQNEIGLNFKFNENDELEASLRNTEWHDSFDIYNLGQMTADKKNKDQDNKGQDNKDKNDSSDSSVDKDIDWVGPLHYGGRTISESVLKRLISECRKYKILPDMVISQMYAESFWGDTPVGRNDNNWTGMTYPGAGAPGINISKGMVRGIGGSEGGNYCHYQSVEDFITDYMYLLRAGNIYATSGKSDFDESVKGLFRVGGAKYDYAASGYNHYRGLMNDVISGIRKTNGNDKINKLVKNVYDGGWVSPSKAMLSNSERYSSVKYIAPIDKPITITSEFGWRTSPINGTQELHNGIDLVNKNSDAKVYSSAEGTVIFAGWENSYGNYVCVQHADGKSTGYAHLKSIAVANGNKVTQGQTLGVMGTTGDSTGVHLHFQFFKGGMWPKKDDFYNPREFVNFSGNKNDETKPKPEGDGSEGGTDDNPKVKFEASTINMFKVSKFISPQERTNFLEHDDARSKYQFLRQAFTTMVGREYPAIVEYINSLQGPMGLEKLFCSPFMSLTLTNGKGTQASFNIANFRKQREPFEVFFRGFLGKTNRLEFGFKDLMHYYEWRETHNGIRNEAAVRKDSLIDMTIKNFDLIIDNEKAYQYLNSNTLRQSLDNAAFTQSQNKIQLDNSERNFRLDQDRQVQVNQLTQSGQRAQLDITQRGQTAQFGINGTKQVINGAIGAGASLMMGNPLGAIGSALGTGLNVGMDYASMNVSQGMANQSLNAAQNTANQTLAANQSANEQIFMNSLATSQLIASNNYDNAIANINAGLSDLKNQPDISAVSGSDYNFEMGWKNDTVMAIIYTTNPQALMSIAEFFAQFGYSIKRYGDLRMYTNVRSSFSYVKTKGANIRGNPRVGAISNKWLNLLNMIFDNGITLWQNHDKMARMDITENYSK